jgi:hypothetical protein
VGGSNPAFQRNRKFAEFFAVYHENRVFRPHLFFDQLIFFAFWHILLPFGYMYCMAMVFSGFTLLTSGSSGKPVRQHEDIRLAQRRG